MTQEQIILHISLIEGVGSATVEHILAQLPESVSLQDCYQFSAREWHTFFGITQQLSQKIVHGLQDQQLLEQELSLIEAHNINWTTLASDDYPTMLKTINLPPTVLYWQGAAITTHQTVAFVGARA